MIRGTSYIDVIRNKCTNSETIRVEVSQRDLQDMSRQRYVCYLVGLRMLHFAVSGEQPEDDVPYARTGEKARIAAESLMSFIGVR